MTFINRAIQEQDRAAYQLDKAESSKPLGVLLPKLTWTIDEARHVYLRGMGSSARGPESEPNPKSLHHHFHFYMSGRTYLLSMTNDLTKRQLKSDSKHWDLTEFWTLNSIEPRDALAISPEFLAVLCEAMEASLGGNAYMAIDLARDGWSTAYKLNFEVKQGV